jgi:hypothetical protein
MIMRNNFLSCILLVVVLLFITNVDLLAQCPMCKMSAESNLKSGGTAGKGLNSGILYLLAMPYIMVSVLGYVWWKKRKEAKVDL